jgi:two-component system, cell cycle sensor histidine kinase and response regulator CckA
MRGILRSIFGWHRDTILITEPNHVLRQLECSALSRQYRIIPTGSAEEAVRTAAQHETVIDLLLTEVRLPRVDGWELTELIKLDYPELKVVYISSSSIDAEIKAHTRGSIMIALDNPFHPDRLRRAVHDALETT